MIDTPEKPNLPYVQTRGRWSEAWVTRPFLEVESFEACLAPSLPSARLVWNYGRINDGGGTFATYEPKLSALMGHYVRIMRPATTTEIEGEAIYETARAVWHGVILAGADDMGAFDSLSAAGDEYPTARGLEILLARAAIDGSYIVTPAEEDPPEDPPSAVKIDTILPFNLYNSKSDSLEGNRSNDKYTIDGAVVGEDSEGPTAYVFSSDDGGVWSAADVAEYLLTFFGPPLLKTTLSGTTANLALFKQQFGPYPTVYAGLNDLISRGRGHGWQVVVNEITATDVAEDQGEEEPESTTTVTVEVTGVFDADVTVAGATIASAIGVTADINGDYRTVQSVSVQHSREHRVNELVVRGGPIILCGTLSFSGEKPTLEAAWSDAQETAYKAADDTGRAADKYSHVYTAFRAPPENLPKGPHYDDQGSLDVLGQDSAASFNLGKRFLQRLPLLKQGLDDDAPKEFRPPLSVIKAVVDTTEAYVPVDRACVVDGTAFRVGLSLYMASGEPGIRVKAGSRPNHLLAKNHWSGAADSVLLPTPDLDYETILATVAWASDEYLHIVETLSVDLATDEHRKIVIDVPEAQAWYRLPNTVTDVVNGSLVQPPKGAELRNDRDRLAMVAAMAKAWYSRQRAACVVVWSDLTYDYAPGDFLRNICNTAGATKINAIVSRVSWDCRRGTTMLQTDYCELDFASLGSRRGSGGSQALAVPGLSVAELYDRTDSLPVRIGGGGSGEGGDGLLWGKPTGAFTTGATFTLNPCDIHGADNGVDNVTVYLQAGKASLTMPYSTNIPTSAIVPYQADAEGDYYVAGTPREAVADVTYSPGDKKFYKKLRLDFGLFTGTKSADQQVAAASIFECPE